MRRPAILFGLVLLLAVTLATLWNFVLVHDYNRLKELAGGGTFHTTFIVVGSALFLATIVLATILGIQLLASLRWSQRQANFIASVSHELNSPLSSVKLFAQTLRRKSLTPEERANFVTRILVAAERLSHIIANILRAQEVDRVGDELQVVPRELELRAYLVEYVEEARAVHGDTLDVALEGPEVCAALDPLAFRQVLDNLVDNAIRHGGTKPARVELRIEPAGRWIELQVVDHGVGIPPNMLEHVFDRFYRIEGGEPETGRRGMGIGLNIVRAIVRSHGGTVGARRRGPEPGTVIWIRLPARRFAEAHA